MNILKNGKLDGVCVHADRLKIAQVLSNLLSNAAKISPVDAKIMLVLTEKESCIEFKVIDFGCGIPEENISKIFNKFTQFSYDGKSYGGLGLGLYIVNQIITGHGKEISVSSVIDAGTTFCFELDKPGFVAES